MIFDYNSKGMKREVKGSERGPMIGAFCLVAILSGCGGGAADLPPSTETPPPGGETPPPGGETPPPGGETPPPGGETPPPGGGGTVGGGGTPGGGQVPPPTGPTSPNYATNGFVGTVDNAITTVGVLQTDRDGFTISYRAGSPVEFEIRFVPGSGVSVYSESASFDGSIDAEAQTFTGGGTNFGFGSPNFVRVQTGRWAYAADGAIDQDDGQFRHVFAIADGVASAPLPSGFVTYPTTLGGTLEVFEPDSFSSSPVIATGDFYANFFDQNVSMILFVDPSRSNGLTGALATELGVLDSDGSFSQFGNSEITVNGDPIYTEGMVLGGLAGPNAEEVFGVVNFGSDGRGSYSALLTGSFLGQR